MLRYCKVVSKMNLLIDLFPLIDVVSQIGKGCLSLRVRWPREGSRAEEFVCGFEAQIGKSLVVGAAHPVVDLYEARNRITRTVGIKLLNYLLHECVADLQVMRGVLRLFLFGELNDH